jgi:hypothetical protein
MKKFNNYIFTHKYLEKGIDIKKKTISLYFNFLDLKLLFHLEFK